jgi:ADP-ribosylglycohydrolase
MTPLADRRARARLSLDGLSVGDAFGQRFFTEPTAALKAAEARVVPRPPWRWTDDTAMALSIVEILEAGDRIDEDLLARAFARRWAAEPDRGYGGTAHQILQALAIGESWREVARGVFGGAGSMGNGAAMRVAPLGAWFAGDEEALVREATASAAPTHGHPDGRAGAIAVAAAASAASTGRRDLLAAALDLTPPGPTRDGIRRAASLPPSTPVLEAARTLGNGSQVISSDTVPFALWSAERHLQSYEDAMWATVSALGDRDTTCAIVGGIVVLAGATIPAEWLAAREPIPR